MNVNRIRHTGLVVRDMESAISFYRNIFEMVTYWDQIEDSAGLARAFKLSSVKVRTVKMSLNLENTSLSGIELLRFEYPQSIESPPISLQTVGCTHLAIQVSDLDLIRSRLRERNLDFISEPEQSPDGRVKLAFCRAPENFFLELVEVLE